jgi:hypothetical protein
MKTSDSDRRQGPAGPCAFDALCWVVVVLLMVCCGGFVGLAAALSLRGVAAAAVGAALAAAVFCALLLATIVLTFFALQLRQWCLEGHAPDTPGKE